ncbi:type I restriction enzyme S subunit [Arthrobacter sp. UYNi723]
MTSLDWPYIPMSAISTAPIVYGIVQPGQHDVDGVPFVQTRDIGRPLEMGSLDRTALKIAAAYQRSSLQADDLILSLRGDIGASAIVPLALEGANISRGVARVRPKGRHDPQFIHYALQAPQVKRSISAASRGSTLREISIGSLRDVCVPVPPLPEQRKIAEILRAWDEAIERAETLVRAETQSFGALRRRLFVSCGHEVPLSEVSTRITTKSDGSSHTVMAISAKTGFVAQADKYRRDMAGASLANYTLLRRGEFAYNKGNSLTYPQGCIYALKAVSALVPNVYYSFRLGADLNSNYYEHFFASGALNRQLAQRITSGVRGNGLLNLNADDFFGVKVPVPNRATQDGAADALNMGARKIELLQRKAELLRTQKRGLMQKLLTGQLRVNVAVEIEPGRPDDD